jgi:Fe-S-cluster containining protein
VGFKYFCLQIDCPFLDEESCSIYADRPFACREYLVTSPAAHCGRTTMAPIHRVPLAADFSHAVACLGQSEPTSIIPKVPLILALEWADAHPEPAPERPGVELLQEVFERLATKKENLS